MTHPHLSQLVAAARAAGGTGRRRIVVRPVTKAALTLASMMAMVAALAGVAGPASAKPYPPPKIHLLCSAPDTTAGAVCVLPFGVTTAPNAYSAAIAVSRVGTAGPNVTFAVTAGSLPPGLSLAAPSGTSTAITGNPTKTGTFNFTIKATDANLTSTLAYQVTVTVQGPPDQLVCTPAANGGFLENGVCLLPDAIAGLSYQGQLLTSHKAGGTLSVVSGSLPSGLSLPATFTGSGDVIGGTPGQPGITGGSSFTVQGTGDQGQPLYQAYSIAVDPNEPLTIVPPASGSTLFPGTVGQSFAIDFALSGGGNPYTWSLASGQLPPGMSLQNGSAGPRDANDELAGTPTTAGTYTFTLRLTDYDGQQTTHQFTLAIAS
jgi:large repetitive protein